MNKTIRINYWFNTDDYPQISAETTALIEEHAEERIAQQRGEGYNQGELHYEDSNISIFGWWKLTTE